MENKIEDLKTDLGNLSGLKIIEYTLGNIFAHERSRQSMSFPIWTHLTLIQFAILYTRESKVLLPTRQNDIKRLLYKITEIQDHYLLNDFRFTNDTQVRKFFSILSKQQFWRYESSLNDDIARQLILFVDLDKPKTSFNKLFKEKFDISISQFLKLAYFSQLWFANKNFKGRVGRDMFAVMKRIATDDEILGFFNLLSIGRNFACHDELNELLKLERIDSPIFYPFDLNVWVKKPLIWFKDEYRLISFHLFRQSLKYVIFDQLKRINEFASTFSKDRLESYVAMGLRELATPFKREFELKPKGSQNIKTIDFLIEEKVLLECKATELRGVASVRPMNESLQQALETSVIKGFEQIFEVSKRLDSKDQFGIVLTYKPMYLGDGNDYSREFLGQLINNLTDYDLSKLPINNLHVLSIDEWDMMVKLAKAMNYTIYEVLSLIKEKTKKEGKMYFQKCISELAGSQEISTYDFLKRRFDAFYNEFREI